MGRWFASPPGSRSALTAAPLGAQPTLKPTPAALSIFERDWVLMNWALKFYDRDRDILLEPGEAETAAAEFRKIADADGDGRITTADIARRANSSSPATERPAPASRSRIPTNRSFSPRPAAARGIPKIRKARMTIHPNILGAIGTLLSSAAAHRAGRRGAVREARSVEPDRIGQGPPRARHYRSGGKR